MNNKSAFTLVEVLVSVVILAIGFAGVYSLVATSNRVMNDSLDKEKSNYHASEIIETLHSENKNLATIASFYEERDFVTSCDDMTLTTSDSEHLDRLKVWCKKMGERTTGDRKIRVVRKTIDGRDVYVVLIKLSGKLDKNTVVIKRVFNVAE
jgi:prepilin-type N-terminal cleavage/methylation domain-containing protein